MLRFQGLSPRQVESRSLDKDSDMKKAFISYNRNDQGHASRVSNAARALGWSAFIDEEEVPPGSGWREAIRTALISSDLLIIILTPRWGNSLWTKLELDVYSEIRPKPSKPTKIVLPLEFEAVSGADLMIPLLNETQIVKAASELTDAELRWMLLCGSEGKGLGPRQLWATRGLEATKLAEDVASVQLKRPLPSSAERLRLEDELSSRIKSLPRIREIAQRVFGHDLPNLPSDPRVAWYRIIKRACELDLIEQLCEVSVTDMYRYDLSTGQN